MTVPRGPELEDAVRTALSKLAPRGGPGLADRVLAAVADTPQRSRAAVQLTAWRAAWTLGVATVVVAAGIAVGVVIGNSMTEPIESSPQASATSTEIGTTPSMPGPTIEGRPLVPQGFWRLIDLPDPGPGVFSTTRASDVVAFKGAYIAFGSFEAGCASDTHDPPPDCEAALQGLSVGSNPSAVVWLSQDARSWELLPHQAAFEGASMQHAATDGSRIVVTGMGTGRSGSPPVVWLSEDGRSWDILNDGAHRPEHLVWTEAGFIGARNTEDGPRFVASDDGRSWSPLSEAGDLGPGTVMGMAVGLDGTTVVAFGATYAYEEGVEGPELVSITAASWMARDGVTWERASANDGHEGAWMSSATETPAGWVAVGLDQTTETGSNETAVWTSPDGLTWTREGGGALPLAPHGSVDHVVWDGEQLVATGTVSGDQGSVIAGWLSRDGKIWDVVAGQDALETGTPDRLVSLDGWIFVVGARVAGPEQYGVVWVAAP